MILLWLRRTLRAASAAAFAATHIDKTMCPFAGKYGWLWAHTWFNNAKNQLGHGSLKKPTWLSKKITQIVSEKNRVSPID